MLARLQDPVRQVRNRILDTIDFQIALVDDKTLPWITEDVTYPATDA